MFLFLFFFFLTYPCVCFPVMFKHWALMCVWSKTSWWQSLSSFLLNEFSKKKNELLMQSSGMVFTAAVPLRWNLSTWYHLPHTHRLQILKSARLWRCTRAVTSQKYRLAAYPPQRKQVKLNGYLVRHIYIELVKPQTYLNISTESKSPASPSLIFVAPAYGSREQAEQAAWYLISKLHFLWNMYHLLFSVLFWI